MFHCTDCGISFPSAALLSNHKQRFCLRSRVDQQTQMLLQGDGPFATHQPSRLDGSRGGLTGSLPPMMQQHQQTQHQQQFAPRAMSVPPGYGQQQQQFPQIRSPTPGFNNSSGGHPYSLNYGGGGGGGGGTMMNYPTSNSIYAPQEPVQQFQRNYFGPQAHMAQAGPMMGPGAPHLAHQAAASYLQPGPGVRGGYDPEMYRVLEQQQMAINQLQGLLGNIAAPNQQSQQPIQYKSGQNVHGMNGYVIEGRYGLRVYAAEGLLAFHTVADHTPVILAVRQYYCRRRIGNYLPELEQRDEWAFRQEREVTGKRRDGYLNFGRAEYVFNVVTANEVVLVIELLSRGRLIAWTECLMDSLGDKVRRLRHPPIDIAGALRDVTLRSTTATIGFEIFRARWDNCGDDGDDEEEEEEEDDEEEEGPALEAELHFFIDKIEGVPFNVLCTRALVHVSIVANEIGDPVNVAYPTPTSRIAEPEYVADAFCKITESSCVVVVVEAIESKKKVRVTLGHAVIPVRIGLASGNFKCRIRRGEPNRQQLIPYENDVKDYIPCMALHYRLDSTDKNQPYKDNANLGQGEQILIQDRKKAQGFNQKHTDEGITAEEMPPLFSNPVYRELFDQSFLCPYQQNRGLFVNVEGLRGVGKEMAMYKVVVKMAGQSQWTKAHDFKTDVGTPKFTDGPMVFRGIPHDTLTCAIFVIYKLTEPNSKRCGKIAPAAWAVAKMFLTPDAVRNGRFIIPVFAGEPPPEFIAELNEEAIEGVMMDWINRNDSPLQYYNYTTLTFGQGDPLRTPEQCENYMTKPQAKVILVPEASKSKFPLTERGGETGFPAARIHGDEAPEEFMNGINAQFKNACPEAQ